MGIYIPGEKFLNNPENTKSRLLIVLKTAFYELISMLNEPMIFLISISTEIQAHIFTENTLYHIVKILILSLRVTFSLLVILLVTDAQSMLKKYSLLSGYFLTNLI